MEATSLVHYRINLVKLTKKNLQSQIQFVFKEKTNNTYLQLFRYTFVGGFAFLVDFGTLYVLTEFFGIHYLVSAGVAFIFGLTVNYFLSVKWVFNDRVIDNRWMEFLMFTIIGIVGLGLTELFLWIFTNVFLIFYLFSKIITAFIVYFWNFFARKVILFNK